MSRRRKPRKNYRKGTRKKRPVAFLRRLAIGFYAIAGAAALLAASCFFVLVYDVITQCDYFKANRLQIDGSRRLSKEQIVAMARVQKGMNILSVNLAITRKRLLAHPWIAEAEVRREIPAGLRIRIQEHEPLAIIDVGRKFLINEKGQVFKEWTAADPENLPLISGLQLADISSGDQTVAIAAQQSQAQRGYQKPKGPLSRPFEAVMQVLILGKQAHIIPSNRHIKQIVVDRELGITLKVFRQMKTVVLGYHNYPLKFRVLKKILAHGRQRRSFPDFSCIDLNDVNRIVINPVSQIPSGDHKEV